MSTDWYPSTDAGADAFNVNFNAKVVANPGRYGLDAAAAAALTPKVTDFTAALAVVSVPATKTKVTVADKNAKLADVKTFVRSLARIVQGTAAVTNEAKVELGLPLHDTVPSPIPAPGTAPMLGLIPKGPHLVELRIADSSTPDSRRKPNGVTHAAIFWEPSATPITDPDEITYRGEITRSPTQIDFGAANVGKTVYYAARWMTRTGLPGPSSTVYSTTVGA